jgi:branched-chain amino acid transport system permease protein
MRRAGSPADARPGPFSPAGAGSHRVDGTLSDILQVLLGGLRVGSIYAVVGLGFAIIYNATGIVNFAQGEFLMVGAMAAWWAQEAAPTGLGLPLAAAVPLGVLAAALTGGLFERLVIHPRRHAPVLVLIILTVAGSMFLRAGAMLVWGTDTYWPKPFSRGLKVTPLPHVFPDLTIAPQDLWIWGTVAVMVAILAAFFRFTVTGKAMRACADNAEAAQLMGIDPARMALLSFVLSAAMAGVAGIVAGPQTQVNYGMGAMLALKGFCAAVVGGIGNLGGALIAGVLLGVAENLGGYFQFFPGSHHYQDGISLLVLVLVLFIRPGGFFGGRHRAA